MSTTRFAPGDMIVANKNLTLTPYKIGDYMIVTSVEPTYYRVHGLRDVPDDSQWAVDFADAVPATRPEGWRLAIRTEGAAAGLQKVRVSKTVKALPSAILGKEGVGQAAAALLYDDVNKEIKRRKFHEVVGEITYSAIPYGTDENVVTAVFDMKPRADTFPITAEEDHIWLTYDRDRTANDLLVEAARWMTANNMRPQAVLGPHQTVGAIAERSHVHQHVV